MTELITSIGKLTIGFLGMLGPIVLLMAYLNARDQRITMLHGVVLAELNRPHLRGLYTVRTKNRPLRPDVIVVELWNCSREQMWHVVERLSARVPARVQLEVNGISGCRVNFSGEDKAVFYPCGTVS